MIGSADNRDIQFEGSGMALESNAAGVAHFGAAWHSVAERQSQISEERILALLFPDRGFATVAGNDHGAVVKPEQAV